MNSDAVAGLAKFVASTAVSVAAAQSTLVGHHARRLAAWQQVLATSRGTPLEAVARSIAPSALAIENCTIQASVSIEHDVTTELAVRVLNAGVVSRFGTHEFFRSKLQVEIRRVPLPLDRPVITNSPLERNY